jgi:hypothetical protein
LLPVDRKSIRHAPENGPYSCILFGYGRAASRLVALHKCAHRNVFIIESEALWTYDFQSTRTRQLRRGAADNDCNALTICKALGWDSVCGFRIHNRHEIRNDALQPAVNLYPEIFILEL